MSKAKEPVVNLPQSIDGLLLSEQKELVDYLMEKNGFKRKLTKQVERAWKNVQGLKRDDAE